MKAKFITIEGMDGLGKTTQLQMLAQSFQAAGLQVITTREPGGTPISEAIRTLLTTGKTSSMLPMTELLLFNAARAEHVASLIRPAIARGEYVICDRFIDSTLVYQGAAHGIEEERILALHQLAIDDFFPDITLVLTAPLGVGKERLGARPVSTEDRYERMGEAFTGRLHQGFLALCDRFPERCIKVDAHQEAENVHQSILQILRERLGIQI